MNILRAHSLKTYTVISILFVAVVLFFLPEATYAQAADFGVQNVQDQGLALSSQSLTVTVVKVIRALLGFLGLIAVIIVLYGGYVYMTAGGNEDKVSQAKMILRNGLIGLAIILFSFAIVQFVITKLNQAAGIGTVTEGVPPTGCVDVVSCNFQDPCADVFVAQSITPHQAVSNVNNVVIRAVFTKSVGTPAAEVFTILKDTIDVSRNFTYNFVPGTDKKVIEAVMTLASNGVSAECSTVSYVQGTECVPLALYDVRVNSTVVATDGEGLSFGRTSCTEFEGMQKATFNTQTEANDIANPFWQGIGIINPETNSPFTDEEPRFPAGETYTFVGTTDDDNGVGYTRFHLEAMDGSETPVDIFRGPSSNMFSDKAYAFSKDLFFSSGIVRNTHAPKRYQYTLTTWDIDHHISSVQTGTFVLVGNHCFNEVMDEDLGETNIDIGGACGSDTTCTEDYQCASGLCVEGQCIAKPQITAIDPMDGAPGNWVTIRGYYFGNEEGTVEFGSEEDGWIPANIVECSDVLTGSSWNNTYVIAEVPPQENGPVVENAISLGKLFGQIGFVDLYIPPVNMSGGVILTGWMKLFGMGQGGASGDRTITPRTIFSFGDEVKNVTLSVTPDDTFEFQQVQSGVTTTIHSESFTQIDLFSAWHAITLQETSPDSDGNVLVTISFDGVVQMSGIMKPFLMDAPQGGQHVRIGASHNGDNQLGGSVDEFVLYNVATFPQNFLQNLSEKRQSGDRIGYGEYVKSTSPIGYWRFNKKIVQGGSGSEELINEITPDQSGGSLVGVYGIESDGIFKGTPVQQAPLISKAAIRITNVESDQQDTSSDNFGPKPAYKNAEGTVFADGLFRFTDIVRPGLCAVVVNGAQSGVPDGALAGPPGVNIRAHGTGFGTRGGEDAITFDVGGESPLSSSVFGWEERQILSNVPLAVAPGNPLVHVVKNGQNSNGIPFRVSRPDLSDVKPLITDIDPADPTPGSFVTIYGAHFGQAGYVYVSPNAGANCSHNNESDTCTELSVPPAPCRNTWTDTQIIVDIPDQFSGRGKYYVTVERADNGFSSDGTIDTISVENGEPKPSICQLDPNQGPAILPNEHPGLLFSGKNFMRGSTHLYFWNGSGDITNPDDVNNLHGGSWIVWGDLSPDTRWGVSQDKKTIVSSVGNNELSLYPTMPLGKWPIAITANGNRGNSVNYFVTDCRMQGSVPDSTELRCCTEGPDTGSWKTICEGDVRSSGYVWRFTTGIPPEIPYVLVQCTDDGEYKGRSVEASPVPSSEWAESEEMCINATAQVAISMAIDPTTVPGNVLVYTCGSTTNPINCTYNEDTQISESDLDLDVQTGDNGSVIVIKQASDLASPNFDPNTWYRVLLTTGIKTSPQDVGGGNATSTALRIDEERVPTDAVYPDAEIAFSYDFQTGTGLCSLDSAYITPREKTVTQIGPIHDVYNIDLPFYYYLKGKADRACTLLNVDDLGWEWSSNRTNKATIGLAPSPDYEDTRATSTAHEEAADGVTFRASVSAEKLGEDLAAAFPEGLHANTSTLFINIGPPHVVSYEPNCVASCPNAVVKATFSRHMDPSTYQSGITVFQCNDPNCVSHSDVTGLFEIDTSNKLEVKLSPYETTLLETNTYYKVSLTSLIKSFGGVNLDVRDGQSLVPFSWVFRTKADNTLCGVDRVSVRPHPFIATYIGQKTKFTATPYGAPNECDPRGQEIARSSYTYNWQSTVPVVASTTQFAASLTGSASFCTEACVPRGSDVVFAERNTPICGNGIVDAGEDCDIAGTGEILGLTCSLSCLRPGLVPNEETPSYCGNLKTDNPVERLGDSTIGIAGEACDPTATIRTGSLEILLAPYCTNECLKKGSSTNFNPNTSGYCGDGFVGLEEACDIGIPLTNDISPKNSSALGCTTSCLHVGTPLSEDWCSFGTGLANMYITTEQIQTACASAKSICGNGELEAGEQCEAVNGVLPSNCSNTCTFINTCNSEGQVCNPLVDEGCTSSCVWSGSSLFYSTPSVCGDGTVGIGEYNDCEISSEVDANEQGALQLVTAIGEGQTIEGRQTTEINSSILSENKTGTADYTLQCGFTEYEIPQNGFYNDCVLPTDGLIGPNGLGVASNSCCYQRSFRTEQYPAENEGFNISQAPMCRNTYVEVTFDTEVNPQTIANNAIIARGYESAVNCVELGGTDVTTEVISALGLADGSADASGHGFWSNIWQGIKHFFQGIVQRVFAGTLDARDMTTWCSEGTLTTDLDTPATTIPLYIPQLLGSQTADTAYAVLLRGGKNGILDIHGVGIKHKDKSIISDAWAFEVGTEICKIDHIAVDPSSYLFTSPNTSADFGADAITKQGQRIVSTPAYGWRWEWQPQESTIFTIPADGTSTTSQFIKMGSTNVEGNVTALAQAIVTADVSTTGNQLGNRFEGSVALTSMFCENPWPARADDGSWSPYHDEGYHYSFSYCADAGGSGNTNDDLPFLKINDIALTNVGADVLKRLIFVSDTNTDALGIQIFANPERVSVASWFANKFPNAPIPQKVTFGGASALVGYDAIADQDNYYVDALNVIKDDEGNVTNVYSNIYLFTISQASQASTRDVFQQILDTLEFNTNLTDYGYCFGYDGKTPDFEHQCTTNFDCLLGPQTVTIQEGEIGVCEGTTVQCILDTDCDTGVSCIGGIPEETQTYTSAGCFAEKTQLFRDVERLRDVETIQSALGSGPYPSVENGTFRPNYVASVWSSWGTFANTVTANLPRDPINIWSGCTPADPQTCWDVTASTFVCPQQESVYEYKYNKDTGTYTIHMPFEFFKSETQIEQFFSPSFILDKDAFTTARECQPGQTYTFTTSACGDGVVGPGEQCDPPGSSVVSTKGVFPEKFGTCEYSNSQCLSDTDCETKYVFEGKPSTSSWGKDLIEKRVYTDISGLYCGLTDGGVIVNTLASNPDTYDYAVFSCKTNEDCLDARSYQHASYDRAEGVSIYTTVDLGAYDNSVENISFQDLQTAFKSNKFSIGCMHVEDTFVGDPNNKRTNLQCIGAIQDGQLLSCQTSPQEFAVNTCNNSCQWNYGACEGNSDCGNGRVDPGETCDDGGLNGQYGQCNTSCSGLASSCGDGNLDDEGYEKCDWNEAGFGLYSTEKENSCSWDCQGVGSYCGDGVVNISDGEACDVGVNGVSSYNIDKNLSCSTDCRAYGSYCGDSVIDTEQGETCDDGNNTEGDGCSNSCIIEEGFCTAPYSKSEQICIVGDVYACPVSYFDENRHVLLPEDTNVCLYKQINNQTYLIYTPHEGDITSKVYTCENDAECNDLSAFGTDSNNLLTNSPDVSGDDDFIDSKSMICGYLNQTNDFIDSDNVSCIQDVEQSVVVTPSPPQETIVVGCGNGIVNTGEQCDPAEENTKDVSQCSGLGYGQSCTYCSNACRIETIDSSAYCGNETIDQKSLNVYESCEQLLDGTILVRQSNGTNAVESCEGFEHGTVSCTNSCSIFTKDCFDCGLSASGAKAYISFVNPMLASNSTFSASGVFGIGLYKEDFLGDVQNPERVLSVNNVGTGIKGVMKNVQLIGGIGGIDTIETSDQCNAECQGNTCTAKKYFVSFDVNDPNYRNFEKFPYIVSGQTDSVTNEYVTSPSVPQGSIRVVIRWTREEENAGANMRGFVYGRENAEEAFLVGFTDGVMGQEHICKEAVASGSATIPSACSAYEEGVYVHPETGLENTFVQATTMDLATMDTTHDQPLAMTVRNLAGAIAPWKNKNITVDVYTYHEGQTLNSIYAPTFSYQIKTSANTSNNATAIWWHVFNLIPQDALLASELATATDIEGTNYAIVPVQSLETDDCELQNNMYTTQVDCS